MKLTLIFETDDGRVVEYVSTRGSLFIGPETLEIQTGFRLDPSAGVEVRAELFGCEVKMLKGPGVKNL